MIEGKWNITLNTPMGEKSAVLELILDGSALSGSLSDADHHVRLSDGKADGTKLRWSAKLTKPMNLTFKFSAVVEGDRISGTAKHLLGSATFSGTRA